ncbi:phosphotransferase enzyme family protein [Reyranella soli]|jgi:Ser/Thr protein kinase RdoA (MazF antagonist)|uniref:Homoserine kinase n=1 Tax=Reyranella soli TaxID=1230389 RepID=A0A512NPS5_9HYPH|nr:phosphotransferase [Reyranella soli]GEP60943.1 homoserine kinase [Reyranella soli]
MADGAAADIFAPAANEALRAFPIEPDGLELVSHSENITYRVVDRRDGAAYGLRLHRPWYHTIDELISERDWIRALDDAGIAVQAPMRTRDGQEYASVIIPATGERRFAGLARWTTGRVLAEVLRETTDIGMAARRFEQLGALTASLHDQAAAWQAPATFTRHALDADGLMGDAPHWGPFWDHRGLSEGERRLMLDTRARLHAALAGLDRQPVGYSLIHADMHPGNVLVDGDALTVIDFDDAGWGWHAYDIAVALFYQQRGANFEAFERAYVAGYRSVRRLSEQSLALLPMFRLIRGLAQIGWFHQRPELDRAARLEETKAIVLDQCREFLKS